MGFLYQRCLELLIVLHIIKLLDNIIVVTIMFIHILMMKVPIILERGGKSARSESIY
jgi:hypothetical protein